MRVERLDPISQPLFEGVPVRGLHANPHTAAARDWTVLAPLRPLPSLCPLQGQSNSSQLYVVLKLVHLDLNILYERWCIPVAVAQPGEKNLVGPTAAAGWVKESIS